jgi:hypothetical protein
VESGPAFLVRDSKDLELDGVTTRKPSVEVPVVRLDNCPDAIVRNSRAFAGTGIFLSTAPGELKSVVLEGNAFSAAREAKEEKAAEYWKTTEPATERE